MKEIFRLFGERISMIDAPSTKQWKVGDGIRIFPEGRCPFCKEAIQSKEIWSISGAKLKGRWKIVSASGPLFPKILEFLVPRGNRLHPHIDNEGNICLGNNKTPETALFFGMNRIGSYYPWAPFNMDEYRSPDKEQESLELWESWLRDVWGHDCDSVWDGFDEDAWNKYWAYQDEESNESCELCTLDSACGVYSPDEDYVCCTRPSEHPGEHIACVEGTGPHEIRAWSRSDDDNCDPAICSCVHTFSWCNNPNGALLRCSLRRGHAGNHRACSSSGYNSSDPRDHNLREWENPTESAAPPECDCIVGLGVQLGAYCATASPTDFYCTRRRGHTGLHRACNIYHHQYCDDWPSPQVDQDLPF